MNLLLRDVPDDVQFKLKADAKRAGMSLRDYCLDLLTLRSTIMKVERQKPITAKAVEPKRGKPIEAVQHKPGQKCPHGYANSLTCPDCRPQ